MELLPSISVIIPTRDRPVILGELLQTLVDQTYAPLEAIVIDDSPVQSGYQVAGSFASRFDRKGSRLEYLKGTGQGNTSARNIGILASKGEALLFLDDDILLGDRVLERLAEYLRDNPNAMGVQPVITAFEEYWNSMKSEERLQNMIRRALMLSYHAKDKQSVRRSAASVYGSHITHGISVQRTTGCCLFRRIAVEGQRFDTNLRRRGLFDDLDFSYNIYLKYPGTLFCIPQVRIIHKSSKQARQPREVGEFMEIIYWAYIFFKDRYKGSLLNLTAFLWALTGGFTWSSVQIALSKNWIEKRAHISRLKAYAICVWRLGSLRIGDLDFFNRTLS